MDDNLKVYIEDLELKIASDTVFSIEDKILVNLFQEKGATKEELNDFIKKVPFFSISQNIINMENKGLIVAKKYYDSNIYYYLTSYGANECEYRFNTEVYFEIYNYLINNEFNELNVMKFLQNRFYHFYIDGTWNSKDFINQYNFWCSSNGLDPKKSLNRSLKVKLK